MGKQARIAPRIAVARQRSEWSNSDMPVEKKLFHAWLGELRLTRRQLRSAIQGKQRTRLRSSINERAAKKMDEFSNGRPAAMLQKVLKKAGRLICWRRLSYLTGTWRPTPSASTRQLRNISTVLSRNRT
jgi:hypothetical protein